jgi:Ca-activated chloride channel family protein
MSRGIGVPSLRGHRAAIGGVVVALAVAAALATAPGSSLAAQQASFSARVDSVRVDIDVRRNNVPVSGLTAEDFEVLDNGVRQKVELVASTALPVSVVLALDTSASLDPEERTHLVAAGTRAIDALRPTETAALLTFSDRVAIHSTFTADAAMLRTLVAAPMRSGDTALYDAAHAAMLLGTSAPGRSLVILFSDGDDTASFLTDDDVAEAAQRTGSVVCVVMIGGEGRLLQRLANTTGGLFVKETSLDRVAARFAEILDSFRNRYLVSFTPTGVTGEGWHKLTVRVKGGGSVRARAGYWAGAAAAGG